MENYLANGSVIRSEKHKYVVQSVLGKGGFGVTYKATVQTMFNNIPVTAVVAVKEHFLKDDCEREADTMSVTCSNSMKERYERSRRDFAGEARRLQAVSPGQPNIVQVNEVFDANNTSYYVMEYIEGETLRDYVDRRGPLSELDTLDIMEPIIRAVGYLHRNHITHLDIKPGNIMIAHAADSGRMRPVLIDFGLSKHYNADGSATSTINTQGFSEGYAPVEQYAGITRFSPASDVYALAATILFCLTGKTPPRSIELTPDILETLIPRSITPKLRKLLISSLQMQSNARPANADTMYAMLRGTSAYRPAPEPTYNQATMRDYSRTVSQELPRTQTTSTYTKTEVLPKTRRKGVPNWLIILILLVAIGGAAGYFIGNKTNTDEIAEIPMEDYAGDYVMTGKFSDRNGEYPVKFKFKIDQNGNITGVYSYDLTIRKYGDVPSSYFSLDGTLSTDGTVRLTSRLHNHNEPFETFYLSISQDKHRLDGYLENCTGHDRLDVDVSN